MRRGIQAALVVWCVTAALAAGCGGSGGSGGEAEGGVEATAYPGRADSVPDADGRTPFDVLHGAVMAANAGDFAAAEVYILPESAMGTDPVGRNVMPQKWPPFTRNGNIARLEFVGEQYHDKEVTVEYRVHYNDASTFRERATIERVDNRWKIAWMTHENPF